MSNWDLIESIIDSVLLLPKNSRKKYVEEQYGDNTRLKREVLDLLEAIEISDEFFDDASEAKEKVFSQFADKDGDSYTDNSLVGSTIGKYKIIKLISHGGMGTVYHAKRNDGIYDQEVALKLIRHGMDTPNNISRFERERYILAGLNHPNIAGLIDGGVTRFGLPYLVMEYVDGLPIDEYCDKYKLKFKDRIKLFNTICETVQFAHNNMVIHRDLKPDNIFVDQNGVIKILDFGIAKLLETGLKNNELKTEHTHQVLTPCSAAPEQVNGENVTTATDTYSLGILLYKLLSGIVPFTFDGLSMIKKQEVILSYNPLPPSEAFLKLNRSEKDKIAENFSMSSGKLYSQLKCDIDVIVSKALRKEINARYQTANDLANDLNRYLNDLPVNAHQGHYRYIAKKFIRRNYKSFSTAAAILLIITSFSIYHTYQIANERNLAQTEAKKATQVTNLLFNLFEASEPGEAMGDTITAQELLKRGLHRAELLQEQPAIQGQMYHVIGQIYYKLGNYDEARPLINQTIDLFTEIYDKNHPETAYAIASLGALQSANGQYHEAEITLNNALKIYSEHRVSDVSILASMKSSLAYTMRRQGDFDSAERLFREGFEILHSSLGPNHIETITFKNNLGTTLFNIGKYEEAESIYREILPMRIDLLGDMHPSVAETKSSLGALMMILGNLDEANLLLNEAYHIRANKLGEDHPKTLLTKNNLALLNRDLGYFDISEKIFSEVLESRLNLMGKNHSSTAITWFSIAELMIMTNRIPEAEELLNKAIPVFENSFSENHSFTIRSKMTLGFTYLLNGKIEEADKLIQPGYDQLLNIHHEETLERAIADHQLGMLNLYKENLPLADSLLNRSNNTYTNLLNSVTTRQQMVLNDLKLLENPELAELRVIEYF